MSLSRSTHSKFGALPNCVARSFFLLSKHVDRWSNFCVSVLLARRTRPCFFPLQDARFNREIDALTGYRTRALLCMPIKDCNGDVIGVAQVINKLGGEGQFTTQDEKVFASYLQFCGIGLRNAQLYEKSQLEVKRNQVRSRRSKVEQRKLCTILIN